MYVKGHKGWNKGKKSGIYKKCLDCDKIFYVYPCEKETKKYCSRKCKHNHQRKKYGKETGNWRGGRITRKKGYIFVLTYGHPNAGFGGYIREHRLIMEKHLRRYLKPEEIVYHKNGNILDNRIENLELFKNNAKHTKHHDKSRTRDKQGRYK